ncbi:MAG: Fic family protein [Solirubrobacteraceae bacterium]
MADDPYVYPGTDVLRNRLGIRQAADLAEREAPLSVIRIAQLELRFIPGDYDLAHLQATHRYIFGDIYPWAGELRTVRIAKGGDLFALPEHIGPYLTTLFADLAREDFLHGLGREQFEEPLTHYYAEINAVHPFRDGRSVGDHPGAVSQATRWSTDLSHYALYGRYWLEGCETWLAKRDSWISCERWCTQAAPPAAQQRLAPSRA